MARERLARRFPCVARPVQPLPAVGGRWNRRRSPRSPSGALAARSAVAARSLNDAPASHLPSATPEGAATDRAQLLRATSRTFAIGIENLPAGLRETIRTAYLLLRVSDYIEDSVELSPETKARLLSLW